MQSERGYPTFYEHSHYFDMSTTPVVESNASISPFQKWLCIIGIAGIAVLLSCLLLVWISNLDPNSACSSYKYEETRCLVSQVDVNSFQEMNSCGDSTTYYRVFLSSKINVTSENGTTSQFTNGICTSTSQTITSDGGECNVSYEVLAGTPGEICNPFITRDPTPYLMLEGQIIDCFILKLKSSRISNRRLLNDFDEESWDYYSYLSKPPCPSSNIFIIICISTIAFAYLMFVCVLYYFNVYKQEAKQNEIIEYV